MYIDLKKLIALIQNGDFQGVLKETQWILKAGSHTVVKEVVEQFLHDNGSSETRCVL